MLVFVYGTLKKKYGNYNILEEINANYVRTSSTLDKYYMIKTGIPFVINDNKKYSKDILKYKGYILIEEYLVDKSKIDVIDSLEGYPDWYERKIVEDIEGNTGWLYFNDIDIIKSKEYLVKPNKYGIIKY